MSIAEPDWRKNQSRVRGARDDCLSTEEIALRIEGEYRKSPAAEIVSSGDRFSYPFKVVQLWQGRSSL